MIEPNSFISSISPISQILLEITALFYLRLIVVDGLFLPISTAGHFHFSGNQLLIHSTIEMIPSKCVY
jgi:hypothetical protein